MNHVNDLDFGQENNNVINNETDRLINQAQRINDAQRRLRTRQRMWANAWQAARTMQWIESGRKNK